jgi:alpha-glucosidase (family GH31 glycosyl hydrolase)
MWHAWERGETCTGFWWESPKEKDHLEDQGVDGIKMDLGEIGWGGGVWSGFTWFRIGTVGGLL